MDRITAERAKYIKLGTKGCWEALCLEDGTLRLGYDSVHHDLALSGDVKSDFPSWL